MELRLKFSAVGDRAKAVVVVSEFWGAQVVSLLVRDDTVDLRLAVPGAPELLLGFLDALAFRFDLQGIVGIDVILASLRAVPKADRMRFNNPYPELQERKRIPLKGDRFARKGRLVQVFEDALGRHEVAFVDVTSGEEGIASLAEFKDGSLSLPELRVAVPEPKQPE